MVEERSIGQKSAEAPEAPKPLYEKWQIVEVYERCSRGVNKGALEWWLQGQITGIQIMDGKVWYQVRRIIIDKNSLIKGYENFWEPNKWLAEELIKLIAE